MNADLQTGQHFYNFNGVVAMIISHSCVFQLIQKNSKKLSQINEKLSWISISFFGAISNIRTVVCLFFCSFVFV